MFEVSMFILLFVFCFIFYFSIQSFRTTLRFIRYWGKRHGVYSNVWCSSYLFLSDGHALRYWCAKNIVRNYVHVFTKGFLICNRLWDFFGGINGAILVGHICQLYPNVSPSMLISRFFRVYSKWKWPNPVMLCPIEEGSLGLLVWDPRRNFRDRGHHMLIITPAYPCMNSSYNVSVSTRHVMVQEFTRAFEICQVRVFLILFVLLEY
jgi:poly(A) polymerase